MQTNARNQFAGTVKSIKNGAVNSEIIIELAGGKEIAAAITCESVAGLDLEEGKSVLALVKADVDGLAVSAGITLHSAQALHLQVGQTATALFKASAVVLAVKK